MSAPRDVQASGVLDDRRRVDVAKRTSGYGGFVYVVGATDSRPPYKIGMTTSDNPRARLSGLQVGAPVKLKVVQAFKSDAPRLMERMMHKRLASYRTHGEWFDCPLGLIRHEWDYVRREYAGRPDQCHALTKKSRRCRLTIVDSAEHLCPHHAVIRERQRQSPLRKSTYRQCDAVKKDGERCRGGAKRGTSYCGPHTL